MNEGNSPAKIMKKKPFKTLFFMQSRSGYDWGRRQFYRWFHLRPLTRRLSSLMHRICDLDGSEDDPAGWGDPAQKQTRTSNASDGKKGEYAQTCCKTCVIVRN